MISKANNKDLKFSFPRTIIGLWQIADMERNNNNLDLNKRADYLNRYVENGFRMDY